MDMISVEYVENLADASGYSMSFGGSPGNIAKNLADLGIEVSIISHVGDDSFGHKHIEILKSRGVNTNFIQYDPDRKTSFTYIGRSKNNPVFMPFRGADYYLEYPEHPGSVFLGNDFFHFSSWPISREPSRSAILKMIKEAKKNQTKICFDPNYREILWEKGHDGVKFIKKLMKDIFLTKPSDDDAFHMFGKMSPDKYVDLLHSFGTKNVILTLGKDGAIVSDGNSRSTIPSLAENVVDTTGAGDGFWSGVYSGLLEGKNIFEAAVMGSAIAAYRIETEEKNSKLPPIKNILEQYLPRR